LTNVSLNSIQSKEKGINTKVSLKVGYT